ncbi:MAG: hypothetical protein Q9207_003073 [Kuettlingeria erythrocarpa]
MAYRITIKAEHMVKHHELSKLLEIPVINAWLGPNAHVVSYTLKGTGLYNFMFICRVQLETLDDMRQFFKGRGPRLCMLLDIAGATREWDLHTSRMMNTWIHPNSAFALLGDACHPMHPYLSADSSSSSRGEIRLANTASRAQGAAQAFEDAAVLGALFSKVQNKGQIRNAIYKYEQLRKPRATKIVQESSANGMILHMLDGEEQRERDRRLRYEEPSEGFPNQWADPPLQSTIARVEIDLNLLDLLEEDQNEPLSSNDLARKTGADVSLMKLGPFAWMKEHPREFKAFVSWMTAQRKDMPSWLDVFPVREQLGGNIKAESVLLVDIGGGPGHQCVALKKRYPNLRGRIILQDTEDVIKEALFYPGIEAMVHDFWTEQPVKGALAYYLRNIMHDWPDRQCIQILRNIIPAMSKDSKILIDEMIAPSYRAHWRATQLDMTMMSSLAALERRETDWQSLLKAAGLRIVDIHTYTEELQDSIIVAVPV